jgi:hypothetical protein
MEKSNPEHKADPILKRLNFDRRTFLKGLLASGIGVLGDTIIGPLLGMSSEGSATQKDGDFLVEQARKVPIIRDVDVLVVGGGMAGVGAAVAAGRMGLKTLLVEYFGCLGGNGTSGMVNNFCGYTTSGENRTRSWRGSPPEVVRAKRGNIANELHLQPRDPEDGVG